jgi:RNA polymerase sigma-70 factor (ECF subfamily)
MSGQQEAHGQRFPTTSWSLVGRAGGAAGPSDRAALDQLLRQYLPALHQHLVFAKNLSPDQADDVLHDFVAGKILERELIAQADRDLGKFRTFLLTALNRYWLNRVRAARTRKRAAAEGAQPLGDRVEQLAMQNDETRAFEVAWARNVLSEALTHMQTHCEQTGRGDLWGVFEARVVRPSLSGCPPTDYDELVVRFQFRSPSQACNVLATAKRMFARTLRAVVAEYARDPQEIDEELRDLQSALAMTQK